jgi:1-deoxy-D-xylulose-5-phosphate synthase
VSGRILDTLSHPRDLRGLSVDRLTALAGELRQDILDVVSRRGGHLASNLGVVELTVALLTAFDLEKDRIVWDTGHQGYVYKMLTGRRGLIECLRQDDGCCGFLHRDESSFDVFGAGHAGTAISAALGLAAARDRRGEDGRVVAVVGDGALGCGSSLEGLNNVIEATEDFVLVLNDNRMSIAPNVGALSQYLSRMIASERYNRFRSLISDTVRRIPRIGPALRRQIRRVEEAAKSVLLPGIVFEELGMRYIGPLDGHDLPRLIDTLKAVRRMKEPLVVHVLTEKGHGYTHAENAPEVFHGTGCFDKDAGVPLSEAVPVRAASPTFSSELGRVLCTLRAEDERVTAITAGMCFGTGLKDFSARFGESFHDVGIAEEHAVIFAAGMAVSGLRPVVAIYASFMQRAMDYVFHDVCLQNLPVVFCLDRSGVVSDGPTHHGIHDLGFWRSVPNLSVLQPADGWELEHMMRLLLRRGRPAVVRYPKAGADALPVAHRTSLQWGQAEVLREGDRVALWAVGRDALHALEVADALERTGTSICVVNPRFLIPFDRALMARQLESGMTVVVWENHCRDTGLGSMAREAFAGKGGDRILVRGWPNQIIPWGTEAGIRRKYRMDAKAVADDISALCCK